MKKSALAALIAATLSLASVSFAQPAAEAPVVQGAAVTVTAQALPLPAVSMADAVAAAEKAYDAKAVRANLRLTKTYGEVWCVRLLRADGTRVKAYIDAKTGKTVAADQLGIAREGRQGPNCGNYGPRHHGMMQGRGHGHGFGHHGFAQGPRAKGDCPQVRQNPPCVERNCPLAAGLAR